MKYTYTDEHSVIELESLERGNAEVDKLQVFVNSGRWTPKQYSYELERRYRYIKARIPEQYWNLHLLDNISRTIYSAISDYESNLNRMVSYGLGFTFLGEGFKQTVMSLLARDLCDLTKDKELVVFVVTYVELVYFFRQSWNDPLLKAELNNRFDVDFFFLVDIPSSDVTNYQILTELLARLQLRIGYNLPTFLSVNVKATSLNDILRDSFVGQIVFPFASVNKPIVIDEICNYDMLYERKWELADVKN